MTIRLPATPDAKQYEDFLGALFLSTGHFTETNPYHRTVRGVELLEVDVIATSCDDGTRCLVEAKSGGWGFSDLFKLYGQVHFLGLDRGHLYSLSPIDERKHEAYVEFGSSTNVDACHLDPAADLHFADHPCPTTVDEELRIQVLTVAWYGHIAKRIAMQDFRDHCKTERKSGTNSAVLDAAARYQNAVLKSFFVGDGVARVRNLYEAWTEQPRLVGELVEELTIPGQPYGVWNDIEDRANRRWLQYLMHLEHTGRFLILNEASRVQIPDVTPNVGFRTWGEITDFDLLPQAFQNAARMIQGHPYSTRIPYLFQVFLEVFGGWMHLDGDDADMLSQITGVPTEDIVPCLKFLDELFPLGGTSWFRQLEKNTEPVLMLMLVPAYLRGVGSFARKLIYQLDEYADVYEQGAWLISKWHSALYRFLEDELEPAEQ